MAIPMYEDESQPIADRQINPPKGYLQFPVQALTLRPGVTPAKPSREIVLARLQDLLAHTLHNSALKPEDREAILNSYRTAGFEPQLEPPTELPNNRGRFRIARVRIDFILDVLTGRLDWRSLAVIAAAYAIIGDAKWKVTTYDQVRCVASGYSGLRAASREDGTLPEEELLSRSQIRRTIQNLVDRGVLTKSTLKSTQMILSFLPQEKVAKLLAREQLRKEQKQTVPFDEMVASELRRLRQQTQ